MKTDPEYIRHIIGAFLFLGLLYVIVTHVIVTVILVALGVLLAVLYSEELTTLAKKLSQ